MNLRKFCEACQSEKLQPQHVGAQSISKDQLTSDSFAVTNKDYGICLETVHCIDCGLWQPRFCVDFKDVVKFYGTMEDNAYLESSEVRGRSNYQQILNILKEHIGALGPVLEIGAGSGAVVNFLKKDYPSAEGLEPNRQFCAYALEKYGVVLKNIPYELLERNARYKAVIAFDVIEHLTSPAHFLACIHDCLETSGIAIIVTPDIDSFAARMMKKKWWHIRPPHLFYFNDNSFSRLWLRHHFEIIEKRQFYWSLPLAYLIEVLQQWVFRRTFIQCRYLSGTVKINLFDSKMYVLRKKVNEK